MAYLMLFHEQMRYKRKINKLQRKLAEFSHKYDNVSDMLKNRQKIYQAKESMLDSQAKKMQSRATCEFQNKLNLGSQNQMFNPGNFSGTGITSFVAGQMQEWLVGNTITDPQTNEKVVFDQAKFQNMLIEYQNGTLRETPDIEDGKPTGKSTGKFGVNGDYSKSDVWAFNVALNQAKYNQNDAQMLAQQMSTDYSNNISIWVEAQKAQMKAEQDEALAPLELMETQYELEKEQIQAELERAKECYQSFSQITKEGIKDSVPKFGL